ncbi:MAG: non-homologous end-joining DNA ligase [Terriglobia bacterium]
MARDQQMIAVGGRKVQVSNVEKLLYPAAGFSKGQVIDYYIKVANYILPHLRGRPCSLKRFPDGVGGESFWEKNVPGYAPEWIKRFTVLRRQHSGEIHYVLIDDLPTLVWVANIASIELHPFLHRAAQIDRPTEIVFDLDPGPGADVLTCVRVALLLRELLESLKLESFPKVSGSKGLQVYVPLNGHLTYSVVGPFARSLAAHMEQSHPDLVVANMSKRLRSQKVLVDWSQNSEAKTTIGVYSLRAKNERPYVSLPVDWEELRAALRSNDANRLCFSPEEALNRVKKSGDLFAPVEKLKQSLPRDIVVAAKQSPGSLNDYRRKRDFSKTPEPSPFRPTRSAQGSRRRFVIQKHAASHLHYDFRLEMGGALKSWAVPKGPPYAVETKRLAMATEDHPIEYLDFEGIIPPGQYGGGTVMVWDIGTYDLINGNYYRGFLHVHLTGKKLTGEWTLVRSHEEGETKKWYMGKAKPGMRPISAKRDDQSALSGRTMKQIAAASDREWQSSRAAPKRRPAEPVPPATRASDAELDLKSLPKSKLQFVVPMLARAVSAPPDEPGWQYEIKLDGYRAIVVKKNAHVAVFSRRGNSLNQRFPSIAAGFGRLAAGTIADGEIVALDEEGRPDFNALQNAAQGHPLYFYGFDLLAYKGKDLSRLELSNRRQALEQALAGLTDPVRLSPTFSFPVRELVRAAREQGMEGIVAKRVDSTYEPGLRTGQWVKHKTQKGQELVVGGYLPGSHVFDSLLVGYYEGSRLIFIAKVRNGFTPALRLEVAKRFRNLETSECPFANLPEPKNARRGKALTREVMQECRWLKPRLVAQVEFVDWTATDHLRHSKFVALRDDKDADEVTRENV